MKLPRWCTQFYAFCFNYFWLPCFLCGRYFSGHEKHCGDLYLGNDYGRTVCPNCRDEAQRRTIEILKGEGCYL